MWILFWGCQPSAACSDEVCWWSSGAAEIVERGQLNTRRKTEDGKELTVTQNASLCGSQLLFFYYNPGNCNMEKKKKIIGVHLFFLSFSHAPAHALSFKYPTNTLNKSGDITVTFFTLLLGFVFLDTIVSGFNCREASVRPDIFFSLQSRSHLFTFIIHIALLILFLFKQLQLPPTYTHLLSMRQNLSSIHPLWRHVSISTNSCSIKGAVCRI